jgi:RNA polymerase sigma-70 factor, ECF subfamily
MELQDLVTASTNLSPHLPTNGHRGRSKRTRSLQHSADQFLSNTGQPDRQQLVDQAIVQVPLNDQSSVPVSRIDYARASDEHLISAAKSFDERAFEELSSRYMGLIRKRVYNIVRNREDAEDVVQETLLKAYRHLSDFRASCSFSTWVTRIAINTALMLMRKRKARPEVSLVLSTETDQTERIFDISDLSPSTEQTYSRHETLGFMLREVSRLPAVYRSVLDQYHAQEKSMQDAADTLGISVASAKSRLFRARRTLRSRLEGQRISIFDACW